jgi:ferredoxin-NADP reductase
VSLDVLLAQVEHDARYVLAFSDGGYTTNMPLADLTGGRAWVAFGYGGGPLGPEHGGPARLLVPHLYFWKSAKWVRGLRLRDTDEPGFWETYGYHMYSRPMAGTAVRGRLTWQTVSASSVIEETPRVRTIFIDVPDWPGHRAGQHVDIRLTAEDGYQAERAYSIASAPGEPLSITVERLEDGEVSPYLTEELRPGDLFEVRGPIGGYFVWGPADGGPLLLLAAGSGVVPLRSMLRYRKRLCSGVPVRLLYSSRSWEDVIYRAELLSDGLQVIHALTREQPRGWTGYARRVDRQMLAEVAWPAGQAPLAYACGPTSFVETVAAGLTELGYPPERIKTERFGATGS